MDTTVENTWKFQEEGNSKILMSGKNVFLDKIGASQAHFGSFKGLWQQGYYTVEMSIESNQPDSEENYGDSIKTAYLWDAIMQN